MLRSSQEDTKEECPLDLTIKRMTTTLPTRAMMLVLGVSLASLIALTATAEQPAAEVTVAAVASIDSSNASATESAASEAEDSGLATPIVESLHAGLIQIMRGGDELGYQGRYDHLSSIVVESFDLQFMASKSVGRHWRKLEEADQQRWLETFVQVITANYAGRFAGFSGEQFETLGEEPAIRDTRVVRTRLVRPSDDPVQLNYRLREVDGRWRIIDIYLNGTVSELALRRSEYSSVLKREGFEKLISDLNDKVASLREG